MPTVTDPYRQVRETKIEVHTEPGRNFWDRDAQRRTVSRTKIVPINTPDRFIHGLKHLIRDMQMKHTEFDHLKPDQWSPKEGTVVHVDSKKYQRELKRVTDKYFRIHPVLRLKLDGDEKKYVKELIDDAKKYHSRSYLTTDPDWSPAPDQAKGSAWHNVHAQGET